MRSMPFVVLSSILVAVLSPSQAAKASVVVYQGANGGDWHVGTNWVGNVKPGAGDRAVIPSGKHVRVQGVDAIADTIEIAGTSSLTIEAGLTLVLQNNNNNLGGSGPDDSLVDGTLYLIAIADAATLRFEEQSHILQGAGKVTAEDGRIEIAEAIVLYNALANPGNGIRATGTLYIQGDLGSNDPPIDGHFCNLGLLESANQIIIDTHTGVSDGDEAIWSLAACNVTMTFYSGSLNLSGAFRCTSTANRGSFNFYASVWTCGTYTRNDGGIGLGTGQEFGYQFFVAGTGATCGNPWNAVLGAGASCNSLPGWRVLVPVSQCPGNCGDD